MKLKQLVIASHNTGKLREMEELLAPLGVEVISAGACGLPEPEETGLTFEENALIKAQAAGLATGLPALSDDSGLVVPAIGGAPGIFSARWTGPEKDYATAFARIQRELAEHNVTDTHPGAYFACVLGLHLPDGSMHSFEGRVDGRLTFPPRGLLGFGYDPIFMPEGSSHTFGEIPAAQKNAMSHRARAFAKLIEFLRATG